MYKTVLVFLQLVILRSACVSVKNEMYHRNLLYGKSWVHGSFMHTSEALITVDAHGINRLSPDVAQFLMLIR